MKRAALALVLLLASTRAEAQSIRIHPQPALHQAMVGLEIGSVALTALGAITAIVIAALYGASGTSAGCAFGEACASPPPVPPELLWAAIGALGVGSIAGSIAFGVDQSRGTTFPSASLQLTLHL